MTKEEFEKMWCENSDMTIEEYRETQVTLPCNCDYEDCNGWVAVSNNPLLIEMHMRKNGGE